MSSNLTSCSPPSFQHPSPWPQISPVVHLPHCNIPYHVIKSPQFFTSSLQHPLTWPQISPVVHLPYCNIYYHDLKYHQFFTYLIATSITMALNLTSCLPPSLQHPLPCHQISPVLHLPHCNIPYHGLKSHQFFTSFSATSLLIVSILTLHLHHCNIPYQISPFIHPSSMHHPTFFYKVSSSSQINTVIPQHSSMTNYFIIPPLGFRAHKKISCHNSKRY
jgi:hypothetical protein